MQSVKVSTEEFIQTLKRSNLPTVVTEGSDDYKFYRGIEESLAEIGVSLFPVGGRGKVLEIFERRREIGRNNVIFLADKDLWVFDGIPTQYIHRKVIYTIGYSIENDLYCDGSIEDFLYVEERRRFELELSELLHWYSFAVARLLAKETSSISDHPNRVLGQDGKLDQSYMGSIGYCGKDEAIYSVVRNNYQYLLRGKNLIELILRQLSARNRATKFGRNQIMEIGATRKGPNMKRISDEISAVLSVL